MEYVCPRAYGKGETATFASAEPGISKVVDGNLRAAMAALFLALRSPCSRKSHVSLDFQCSIIESSLSHSMS